MGRQCGRLERHRQPVAHAGVVVAQRDDDRERARLRVDVGGEREIRARWVSGEDGDDGKIAISPARRCSAPPSCLPRSGTSALHVPVVRPAASLRSHTCSIHSPFHETRMQKRAACRRPAQARYVRRARRHSAALFTMRRQLPLARLPTRRRARERHVGRVEAVVGDLGPGPAAPADRRPRRTGSRTRRDRPPALPPRSRGGPGVGFGGVRHTPPRRRQASWRAQCGGRAARGRREGAARGGAARRTRVEEDVDRGRLLALGVGGAALHPSSGSTTAATTGAELMPGRVANVSPLERPEASSSSDGAMGCVGATRALRATWQAHGRCPQAVEGPSTSSDSKGQLVHLARRVGREDVDVGVRGLGAIGATHSSAAERGPPHEGSREAQVRWAARGRFSGGSPRRRRLEGKVGQARRVARPNLGEGRPVLASEHLGCRRRARGARGGPASRGLRSSGRACSKPASWSGLLHVERPPPCWSGAPRRRSAARPLSTWPRRAAWRARRRSAARRTPPAPSRARVVAVHARRPVKPSICRASSALRGSTSEGEERAARVGSVGLGSSWRVRRAASGGLSCPGTCEERRQSRCAPVIEVPHLTHAEEGLFWIAREERRLEQQVVYELGSEVLRRVALSKAGLGCEAQECAWHGGLRASAAHQRGAEHLKGQYVRDVHEQLRSFVTQACADTDKPPDFSLALFEVGGALLEIVRMGTDFGSGLVRTAGGSRDGRQKDLRFTAPAWANSASVFIEINSQVSARVPLRRGELEP